MYDWASQVLLNSSQVLYYVHTDRNNYSVLPWSQLSIRETDCVIHRNNQSWETEKILNQSTCGLNADLIVGFNYKTSTKIGLQILASLELYKKNQPVNSYIPLITTGSVPSNASNSVSLPSLWTANHFITIQHYFFIVVTLIPYSYYINYQGVNR